MRVLSVVLLLLVATPAVFSLRVGEFATLVDVPFREQGFPAIAYFDRFFGRLRWILSNTTKGTLWNAPVFSGIRFNTGLFLDAQMVNGVPAMSFFNVGTEDDPLEGSLMFNRANDGLGERGWTAPQLVDGAGNVGQFTSLELVDGFPAISYFDDTIHFGGLKFVRALDARGVAWGAPQFLEQRSFVGLYTQLGVLGSGPPAVAYYSLADGDLRFVRASDNQGTAWETPIILDRSSADIGKHTSMSVGPDGIPSIAYYDNENHNLHYIRANSDTGDSWPATGVVIDSQQYTGRFVSLTHLDNGNPAVAYFANEVHELRYKKSSGPSGAANEWDAYPTYIDPPDPTIETNFLTHAISLKVVSGVPMIAFYEQVAADLKSAVSVSPVGANGSWVVNPALDRGSPPSSAGALSASVALVAALAIALL